MIGAISTEVWLAVAYAGLLTLFALGLEAVARHSHGRSRQYELAGFRYHRQHDLWHCPTGQPLHRVKTDLQRRIVHYRATAHVCNACPAKPACTDSDSGRELEHPLNSWLSSELYRFQRGISLFLLSMAGLLLVIEIARHNAGGNLTLLIGAAIPVAALGVRTAADLQNALQGPEHFPVPSTPTGASRRRR